MAGRRERRGRVRVHERVHPAGLSRTKTSRPPSSVLCAADGENRCNLRSVQVESIRAGRMEGVGQVRIVSVSAPRRAAKDEPLVWSRCGDHECTQDVSGLPNAGRRFGHPLAQQMDLRLDRLPFRSERASGGCCRRFLALGHLAHQQNCTAKQYGD